MQYFTTFLQAVEKRNWSKRLPNPLIIWCVLSSAANWCDPVLEKQKSCSDPCSKKQSCIVKRVELSCSLKTLISLATKTGTTTNWPTTYGPCHNFDHWWTMLGRIWSLVNSPKYEPCFSFKIWDFFSCNNVSSNRRPLFPQKTRSTDERDLHPSAKFERAPRNPCCTSWKQRPFGLHRWWPDPGYSQGDPRLRRIRSGIPDDEHDNEICSRPRVIRGRYFLWKISSSFSLQFELFLGPI